jgi:hypothetical protein
MTKVAETKQGQGPAIEWTSNDSMNRNCLSLEVLIIFWSQTGVYLIYRDQTHVSNKLLFKIQAYFSWCDPAALHFQSPLQGRINNFRKFGSKLNGKCGGCSPKSQHGNPVQVIQSFGSGRSTFYNAR